MNQISILLFLLVAVTSFAQTPSNSIKSTDTVDILIKKEELSKEALKTWWQKDYTEDTIPGVSLIKAYRELLTDKKGEDIIVAVLDTKLDIHHEDLKSQIWTNEDEIPDNEKDDDNNGYVDDIHGWDFLSNSRGDYLEYESYEVTRVLKKYRPLFSSMAPDNVPKRLRKEYNTYVLAEEIYKKELEEFEQDKKNAHYWYYMYPKSKVVLKMFFPEEDYSKKQVDSLYELYKSNTYIAYDIQYMQYFMDYELTYEDVQKDFVDLEKIFNANYGINYEDRIIIGDDPENLTDKFYGSPKVTGDVPSQHATVVAGVLAANRSNDIGMIGVSNNIKVMPVVVVASGDEYDKDVALGIRYAVDNGAKVINMSFGKERFSSHPEWVQEAIQYAEKKDVLIVNSAGNSSIDVDKIIHFPTDFSINKEIASNFMVIGASTFDLQKSLRASFSNFGHNTVDIFAPGTKIYSCEANNAYEFSRGTSFSAPIVSGIAALLRSYYPNLTASEVKKILMESGTSYNVDVEITQEDGTKKMVPFSELSKSGNIVNAYNALIMAEQMVNSKK